MNSKILRVSLTRKKTNLSYPIFVGDNLLRNSGKILKEFIYKKKIIVIYDIFFLLIKIQVMSLKNSFSLLKNLLLQLN